MHNGWWHIGGAKALLGILLVLSQAGCSRPPAARSVPVAVDQIPDHIIMVVAEKWPNTTILQSSLHPRGVFELLLENPDGVRRLVRISLDGKIQTDVRVKPRR